MGGVDRRAAESWRVAELSDRLCECGCGERTYISPKTRRSKDWVAGEPRRFRYGHHKTPGVDYQRNRWSGDVKDPDPSHQYVAPIGPPRACACGCGESAGTLRRLYARGHGRVQRVAVRWIEDTNGCWVWQLGIDVHGYGKESVGGRRLKAHRVAYERAYGPIPAGYDVHHDCENKRCVNPAHLRALTPDEHGQLHGRAWRRAA